MRRRRGEEFDCRFRPMTPGSTITTSEIKVWTLDDSQRKARYGVTYLRNICAQAGVGFEETSPGEDVLAVDCEVQFAESSVRVQVKCTSGLTIKGKTKSVDLDADWIQKWKLSINPVYIVIVIVPRDSTAWIEHSDEGTMHKTAAFWARVDFGATAPSISIPRDQRLTVDTMKVWHGDLLKPFSSEVRE